MIRLSRDDALIAELELADDFLGRLRGLMFRAKLPPGGGLWLEPCSSIHMLFMRFPIDVVFVRRAEPSQLEVLAIRAGVRPWIGMAWCAAAEIALELPAGRTASLGLAPGERLRFSRAEEVVAA